MAVVRGIREKVHLPLYDSVSVKAEEQWRKDQGSSTLKFFIDVQGKTKLETNMQSASQLSHYNTFEARAMRVVLSDLPPVFPEDPTAEDTGFDVGRSEGKRRVPFLKRAGDGHRCFHIEGNLALGRCDFEYGYLSANRCGKQGGRKQG